MPGFPEKSKAVLGRNFTAIGFCLAGLSAGLFRWIWPSERGQLTRQFPYLQLYLSRRGVLETVRDSSFPEGNDRASTWGASAICSISAQIFLASRFFAVVSSRSSQSLVKVVSK